MALTEELIAYVAMEVDGTTKTRFNDVEIDLAVWKRYSMREAIIHFWPHFAGVKPTMADFEDAAKVLELGQQLREARLSVELAENAPVGRNIASIFEAVAEEHLVQPTIIYDFLLPSRRSRNKSRTSRTGWNALSSSWLSSWATPLAN